MAAPLLFHKVTSLPQLPDANAVYAVSSSYEHAPFQMYCTDQDRKIRRLDVPTQKAENYFAHPGQMGVGATQLAGPPDAFDAETMTFFGSEPVLVNIPRTTQRTASAPGYMPRAQIAIETQNGVEVLKLYTGSDDPDEEWSGYDGVQYVLPGDRVVYLFDMSNASMDQPLRMKVKGSGSIRRFHLGDLDTGPNYLPVDEMHEARIYELEKTVRQLKQVVGLT